MAMAFQENQRQTIDPVHGVNGVLNNSTPAPCNNQPEEVDGSSSTRSTQGGSRSQKAAKKAKKPPIKIDLRDAVKRLSSCMRIVLFEGHDAAMRRLCLEELGVSNAIDGETELIKTLNRILKIDDDTETEQEPVELQNITIVEDPIQNKNNQQVITYVDDSVEFSQPETFIAIDIRNENTQFSASVDCVQQIEEVGQVEDVFLVETSTTDTNAQVLQPVEYFAAMESSELHKTPAPARPSQSVSWNSNSSSSDPSLMDSSSEVTVSEVIATEKTVKRKTAGELLASLKRRRDMYKKRIEYDSLRLSQSQSQSLSCLSQPSQND